MRHYCQPVLAALSISGLLLSIHGCGQTTGPEEALAAKTIIVLPRAAVLQPGEKAQFSVNVLNPNGKNVGASVSWEATGGTMSSKGLYTAGDKGGNYLVKARTGKDVGQATILIVDVDSSDPVATTISVTPAKTELQPNEQLRFSATVRDQNGNPMSASATWKATGGTITSNGTYAAGSQTGSFSVTASSNGLSASAQVAITTSAPSPSNTPDGAIAIYPGESIQAAVDRYAAGTAFLIKAGTHRRQSVVPKDGMQFIGEAGAVLDGDNAVEHAFRGDVRVAQNVTIRNLEIRNYRNPLRTGAVRARGSSGWVIEDCNIHHNYSGGINTANQVVIRNNYIHHNGQIGIVGGGEGILVENNEIAFNNTRDIFNTEHFWEAGGTKFVKTRNLVVRNNYVHDNREDGLWFDIDNIDALIEGNRVVNNSRSGIHWEISYDAVIRNNYVEGNAMGEDDMWHRGGIRISSSPNVEIYGNTLVNNRHGIVAITQNRGSGEYGVREVTNLYVHDNRVTQNGGVLAGLGITTTGDRTYFTGKGNRWEDNVYEIQDSERVRWHWRAGKIDWLQWVQVHHSDSVASND